MRVRQVIGGGNVETGFIPKEREAQQRRVHHENGNKDQRKSTCERCWRQAFGV